MVPKKIDKFRTKVYLLSKTLVLDFSGFFKLPSKPQQTRGLGYITEEVCRVINHGRRRLVSEVSP